ncbi:hypothetical protein [Paraflavitalea sp. CAU 1676]|uniref:hypothetical protein n=1 Tax=Paraflavitalea sp. CAU 1676 TaxID=3032598 RepID=UPI0023D98052|nr:hypothetical protein [Paraflavitalea sp. CAU 1676]MDF2192036.1 hypothetical protein [Paraflavitalea sp. CAU 1676]
MKKLTLKNVDTIIRLNLSFNHLVDRFGKDPIQVANTSYLFFVRNDSSFFVKYRWQEDFDGMTSDSFSVPEYIENDTLSRWLSKNIEGVNNWLVPFIYKEISNSLPKFKIWNPLEYRTYWIEWYYAGTRAHTYFATHWFEKTNLHNWANINYTHNTSTKFFQLFMQLELICIDMEAKRRRL